MRLLFFPWIHPVVSALNTRLSLDQLNSASVPMQNVLSLEIRLRTRDDLIKVAV